ncbi:MAG: T9SS type A sorting domain-containing protein, partial [Candidatus Delongbacteria bacterium]|nr:T9SS type A sorting domain-containing protein [Candidatus Delongbacteria bacterium]
FRDSHIELTGVSSGDVKWGDYDNDGDLDILLTGTIDSYPDYNSITKIYRNDEGNFTDIEAGLVNVYSSSVAWGDYDNDGDLDILISGDAGSMNISKIYRNDLGAFIDINADFEDLYSGSVAWGDYDNDGDLDILRTGWSGCKIYRNDAGIFTNINAVFNGNSYDSGKWGDFDNDGDLDIILADSRQLISILQNCEGEFIDADLEFIEHDGYDVSCADYDNDGDLDIICQGYYITKLYRNDSNSPNTIPSTPGSLISNVNGSEVTLSWNKATDNETPQDGLSYNIYIGDWRDKSNVKSPMSDISTGYRKMVRLGNTNKVTSWTIKNLSDGKYYWNVQAVDNNFAGSAFIGEQNFIVGEVVNVPGAPIALEETDMTESLFKANWTQVPEAEGYYLDIAYDDQFDVFVEGYENCDIGDVTSYSVSEVNTETVYYYRIKAFNYMGISPPSNTITVQREGSGNIIISSPNGGEIVIFGDQLNIIWTDDISENVRIDLYKYDDYLTNIVESTDSDEYYTWSIPPFLYGEYFSIKISSVDYVYVYGVSTGYFSIFNTNPNDQLIIYKIESNWNDSTWVKTRRSFYNRVSNGNIIDLQAQRYTDGENPTTYKTYDATYGSEYYELRYFDSSMHSGPYYYYSIADMFRYYLDGRIRGHYVDNVYADSYDYTATATDKIYNYVNNKLDYIYDYYGPSSDYKVTTEYIAYYLYGQFERVSDIDYHKYYGWNNTSILKRTNWEYFSHQGISITEQLDEDTAIWSNLSKKIHRFDDLGILRKEERYIWESNEWLQNEADSLYYYDGGVLQRVITFNYDNTLGEYSNDTKMEYVYDDPTLSIEVEQLIIDNYTLEQNYPNPFNPETTISYSILNTAQVQLNVYNIQGQLVEILVNKKMDKGSHTVNFNAKNQTTGMYIYDLKVNGISVESRKMMLLK